MDFFNQIDRPKISQVLQSDPFEVVKWPFLGLSDLELMVEKVTLKNQEDSVWFLVIHGG